MQYMYIICIRLDHIISVSPGGQLGYYLSASSLKLCFPMYLCVFLYTNGEKVFES